MTLYVDSSVVLRFVLGQPGQLHEAADHPVKVTSALTQVECLRVVDSRFRCGDLDEDEYVARRAVVFGQLRRMHRVALEEAVVERACEPFPVPVKALDAMHLATALEWRDEESTDVVFGTHDRQLGRAARALGFTVVGV
jgi:predicted nucleic acid-binding protein